MISNNKKYLIKTLIIVLLFILTGCASNIYNTPFVDIKETIHLKNNLSKNEVISLLGTPLYVDNGFQKNNEIVWVYEVRSREVKSKRISSGEIIPNKNHQDTKSGQPIHHLKITFINNKVYNWNILDLEKSILKKKTITNKKEKVGARFYFHPTLGLERVNYTEYSLWPKTKILETAISIGTNLGLEYPNYRFGADIKMGGVKGIMATIEKRNLFKKINIIIGGGVYVYSPNDDEIDGSTTFFKLGIIREILTFKKSISLRFDVGLNSEENILPSLSLIYQLK